MIFLLELIKIEIKRVLRFLPHIVAGALALCFIIGIISYSASKVLYEKKENKVKIAISIPKNEPSAKFFISVIKDMKSIKENCNFIDAENEDDAYKKVEKGEAYGAIILPRHFVSDILDGTNTPATVLLPNESSIEARLIKDLIDGGTKSLTSAQAGIYAITYEYEQNYHQGLTKALQDSINVKYLDHTLARESYFNHKKVSATGELTTIEYYICSGIILFMLLLGMSFSKYLSPSNKAFYDKLKAYDISKGIIALARTISVFIVYLMLSVVAFIVYSGICIYLEYEIKSFRLIDFCSFLVIILGVSSFVVCIFTIMESQISGTLLLFISAIAMNFISGGFLPTIFLPKVIQSLAPYMLTNALAKQIGNILLEQFDLKEFLIVLAMVAIMALVTAIIVAIKNSKWLFNVISCDTDNKNGINLKKLVKKEAGE